MTFAGLTFKAGTAGATSLQLAAAFNAGSTTVGTAWQTANSVAAANVSDAIGYFTAGVSVAGYTAAVAANVVTYTAAATFTDAADAESITTGSGNDTVIMT
jgi:hypothetical protein